MPWEAASRGGCPAGDVEEAVAQSLRLGERELALEDEQAQPGEQVLGEQRELKPAAVRLKRLERQAPEPELLRFLDPVFDPCVQAVAALQLRDLVCGLVGDERSEEHTSELQS